MAAKLLVNSVFISVGSPSAPSASVKQIVLWVEDKSKKKRLFSILQDSKHFRPPVVVFVDSKMGADLLAEAVQEVKIKVSCCYFKIKVPVRIKNETTIKALPSL